MSKRRRINLDDTDEEYVAPSVEESENEIEERRNESSSHPSSLPSLIPISRSESQHEAFEDAVSRAVSNEENVLQQHEDVENRDESALKNAKPQDDFPELGQSEDDSDVEELPDSPTPEDSIAPVQPKPSPNPSPVASPDNDDDDYVNQVLADQEIGEYDDNELYADHHDDEDDPEDLENQLLDDYEGREGVDYGQEPSGY